MVKHNAVKNGFDWVIAYKCALGAADTSARFLVSKEATMGALTGSAQMVNAQAGEMVVSVRRLDSVIAEAGLPQPGLVKIDVEGAECDVLAGATSTLSASRPLLMIELHWTNDKVAQALEKINDRERG